MYGVVAAWPVPPKWNANKFEIGPCPSLATPDDSITAGRGEIAPALKSDSAQHVRKSTECDV